MPRAAVTDLRQDPGGIPEELLLRRHLPPLQHTGLMTMAMWWRMDAWLYWPPPKDDLDHVAFGALHGLAYLAVLPSSKNWLQPHPLLAHPCIIGPQLHGTPLPIPVSQTWLLKAEPSPGEETRGKLKFPPSCLQHTCTIQVGECGGHFRFMPKCIL